jgi:UDP-N-acetylmuramoyl-L-alanyl-D-glutamate--2,6-diaminopimelate ligase
MRRLIPSQLLSFYHLALSFLGALFYGFPSRRLRVIGVTGTNGKTTVVQLISHILETAGYKTGYLSSVDFKIGPERIQNDLKMTMPGRFFIQRMLRHMVQSGCRYAVIEVTSEGILQHRHRFIDFDAAVLTNVTPEHLERHGGFERYRAAKAQLFASLKSKNQNSKAGKPKVLSREPRARGERAMGKTSTQNSKLPQDRKISVVNLDDPSAPYFLAFDADEKWGYTMSSEFRVKSSKLQSKVQNVIVGESIHVSGGGISFAVDGAPFQLPLMGEFNVENALAAIAICRSQDISLKVIQKACASFPSVPGRMEVVIKEPFTVIVDYGHTPDALEKVYSTIRNSWKTATVFQPRALRGASASEREPRAERAGEPKYEIRNTRLICVFGSTGGGRDKWKRPEMGKVAARFCDQIILTNDDPYDEDQEAILDEIEQGILPAVRCQKIVDRRKAIETAIGLAQSGDVVIITGKGAEPWLMGPKGTKIPWDDRRIVREAVDQHLMKAQML